MLELYYWGSWILLGMCEMQRCLPKLFRYYLFKLYELLSWQPFTTKYMLINQFNRDHPIFSIILQSSQSNIFHCLSHHCPKYFSIAYPHLQDSFFASNRNAANLGISVLLQCRDVGECSINFSHLLLYSFQPLYLNFSWSH